MSQSVISLEEPEDRVAGIESFLDERQSVACGRPPAGMPRHGDLRVSRAGIRFFGVNRYVVAVNIEVMNDADVPSAPTRLEIQAAPLGAFVPWRPLATIAVPSLAPRARRHFGVHASAPRPRPLGNPGGVRPRDLLTAFGLADEPPDQRRQRGRSAAPPIATPLTLPADLMDLLGRETPHWAGNINVLVNRTDVERHMAQALRIYPGRLNMACFFVGAPRSSDAYAFQLRGLGADWQAKLFDMTAGESLVVGDGDAVQAGEWIECQGTRVMGLVLRVPRQCEAGTVSVHVLQRSTGREAVVEFSLDPEAAGTGCYTV